MRIAVWITAIALGFLAGSGVAAEQDQASQSQELPKFKKADKDGNGELTFEEVKELGIKKKTFKAEDLDNDGKLSKYDYKYGVK
jgi:Ca2+-binding EF-hand superfamily protein